MGHPPRLQSWVQKDEHGSREAQGNEAFVTKISLSQGLYDPAREN